MPGRHFYIASRIKQHRVDLGWSKAKLARALNVTAVAIGQWEAGRVALSARRIIAIARAFGIAPGDLTGTSRGRRRRANGLWEKMIRHFKDCPHGDAHVAHMAHAVAETYDPEDDPSLGQRMAEDIRALHRKITSSGF